MRMCDPVGVLCYVPSQFHASCTCIYMVKYLTQKSLHLKPGDLLQQVTAIEDMSLFLQSVRIQFHSPHF